MKIKRSIDSSYNKEDRYALRDPEPTRESRSALDDVYPQPTNNWPNKRIVSEVADPRTFMNNPKVYQNREVEEEQKMASNFFYNNVDPRRKQELSDARMVQEDHNAMANLSERPVYHTFNANEHVEKLSMFNQSTRTRR